MAVADTARQKTQAHGFLFADLRGYTAFVETRGDSAAAQLLRAYRDTVRRIIAEFDGAEIRTEGDSFYVVFPSASDAVLAGLAILEEAAVTESAPLRIGIGVHAGEATETDEGYVGWAVNVAARVCAAAGAGELFVTDTVRGMTRGQVAFRFEERGRRRLKGVAEPVALYAVTSTESPMPPRRPLVAGWSFADRRLSRLVLPLALAVGVLVLTAGAIAIMGRDLGGNAQEGPNATAAVVAASATPGAVGVSPSPTADPAAERAAANDRLRARIDRTVAPVCTDADPEDAPVISLPIAGIQAQPTVTLAGLRCELLASTGPDVVEYWLALQESDPPTGHGRSAQGAFSHVAGERNLPVGDCATETRAWGPWEFGSVRGKLLCSGFGGEALLMWTYEGTAIVALATREDGDVELLYRWWEEHGRLLGS